MRTRPVLLSLAAMLLLLPLPGSAHGVVFKFCSGDVACLIAAMEAANANGKLNIVYLASGTYSVRQPYSIDPPTLGVGLPTVTGNIKIVGAGPEATIIRASRADSETFFGLLDVGATGQLVLERLSLRDGNAAFSAGAIWNRGTVAIHDVVMARNIAFGPGAIINDGSMSIVDSDIRENITDLVGGGCCAISNGGRMEILRSVVQGNGGIQAFVGGILNVGDLTITESVVTNNLSDNIGGIANFANLEIVQSSITNNIREGIVFVFTASELANLQDGRTIIEGTTLASTFGRSGETPAIVFNEGTLSLLNTTVTAFPDPTATTAPLLLSSVGGVTSLQNSIITQPGSPGPVCEGTVTSLGHNIIGDPTGCAVTLLSTDKTGDPGFDAFANGVVPLLSTSQAIDAGNPSACPALDQRNLARVDGNGDGVVVCDIGAVEFIKHVVRVDLRLPPIFKLVRGHKIEIALDVFGNAGLDGEAIDPGTVRAGATGYETAPEGRSRLIDINDDGATDVRLHFRALELGVTCDSPVVALTAKTFSGATVAGAAVIDRRKCEALRQLAQELHARLSKPRHRK